MRYFQTLSVPDRYFVCFLVSVRFIVGLFPDLLSGNNMFDLMFDERDKVRGDIGDFIEEARKHPVYGRYIGGWGFHDDKKLLPLQAADFIAYERRKRTEDRLTGAPRGSRCCYKRLKKSGNGRFGILDHRFVATLKEVAIVKSLGLPPAELADRVPREPD